MRMYGGAWSPSPLWGGVGEGIFAPDQNPSRLPATLPTRGRVKNAAPPRIPYAIVLAAAGLSRAADQPAMSKIDAPMKRS
jgi:hypothetical protein